MRWILVLVKAYIYYARSKSQDEHFQVEQFSSSSFF